MKKNEEGRTSAVCPRCGATYTEYPAMSRVKPYGPICTDCGVREALESIGVPEEEMQHILDLIHRCAKP